MRSLLTRTAVPLAFVLGGITTPVAIAALPATADVPAASTAATALYGEPWLRTELYFGTDRATGPDVSDTQFRRFVASVVTPRFPDGLTELTGQGQFRDSTGAIVRERSHLLVLLYPRTDHRGAPGDPGDPGRVREGVRPGVGAAGGQRRAGLVLTAAAHLRCAAARMRGSAGAPHPRAHRGADAAGHPGGELLVPPARGGVRRAGAVLPRGGGAGGRLRRGLRRGPDRRGGPVGGRARLRRRRPPRTSPRRTRGSGRCAATWPRCRSRAGAFDVVASLQVIEHLWDQPASWPSAPGCCGRPATLLLTTPNRLTFSPPNRPLNPFHHRELAAGRAGRAARRRPASRSTRLLGLRHGRRLARLDRRFSSLVDAQLAGPPGTWHAEPAPGGRPGARRATSSSTADDLDAQPRPGRRRRAPPSADLAESTAGPP